MAVKNIKSGEVHKGYKGGETGCGFDTSNTPNNWINSNSKITCDKDGYKN